MLRLIKFTKDLFLLIPFTFLINPFYKLYHFLSVYNMLYIWIRKHKKEFEYCDFYTPFRDYTKRYQLYKYVLDNHIKSDSRIHYFEFGVASGESFKWWLANATNASSLFYGFDTFEGLPEHWKFYYKKGDMTMSAKFPEINDTRGTFLKGIFQDTLIPFLESNEELMKSPVQKVIHMDADLYTATHFALSQMYKYLNDGDIIMFDEFSVANDEFRAFKDFTESFYITLQPIAAVNNFYQAAFKVKRR